MLVLVTLMLSVQAVQSIRVFAKAERELYGRAPPSDGGLIFHEAVYSTEIKLKLASTKVTANITNYKYQSDELRFEFDLPEDALVSDIRAEIGNFSTSAHFVQTSMDSSGTDRLKTGTYSVLGFLRNTKQLSVLVYLPAAHSILLTVMYEQLLVLNQQVYASTVYHYPNRMPLKTTFTAVVVDTDIIENVFVPIFSKNIALLSNSDKLQLPGEQMVQWGRFSDENCHAVSAHFSLKSNLSISGEFIVMYELARHRDAGQLLINNHGFVNFIAPSGLTVLNRHACFVLDISGSMLGEKLQQIKASVKSILLKLRPQDSHSVVVFNNEVVIHSSQTSSLDKIHETYRLLENLNAKGGTDMSNAIRQALDEVKKPEHSHQMPIIIFMTDGHPTSGITYNDELRQHIQQLNTHQYVIHCIAFGQLADRNLMEVISLENNGRFQEIHEGIDADLQLKDFMSSVFGPVLKNVFVQYFGNQLKNNSVHGLGNHALVLERGKEIIVSGQFKRVLQDNYEFSSLLGGEAITGNVTELVMLRSESEYVHDQWPQIDPNAMFSRNDRNLLMNSDETESVLDRIMMLNRLKHVVSVNESYQQVARLHAELKVLRPPFTTAILRHPLQQELLIPIEEHVAPIVSIKDRHAVMMQHLSTKNMKNCVCKPTIVLVDDLPSNAGVRFLHDKLLSIARPLDITVVAQKDHLDETYLDLVCHRQINCTTQLFSRSFASNKDRLIRPEFLIAESAFNSAVCQPVIFLSGTESNMALSTSVSAIFTYMRVIGRAVWAVVTHPHRNNPADLQKWYFLEDMTGNSEKIINIDDLVDRFLPHIC